MFVIFKFAKKYNCAEHEAMRNATKRMNMSSLFHDFKTTFRNGYGTWPE